MSGGSRRTAVAGLLAAVAAPLEARGETAVAKRRPRRRGRKRGNVCEGEHPLVVTGVAASGDELALSHSKVKRVVRYNFTDAWPKSAAIVASGTVLLPNGQPLEFSGPLDLARSVGSCERLSLVIGPLEIVAPGGPVEIALLLPAIQSAREAARRLLCKIAPLLTHGEPTQDLAGLLNALFPLLTCQVRRRSRRS